jgi:hypothetical protein
MNGAQTAPEPRAAGVMAIISEQRDRLDNILHRLEQMLIRTRGPVPEEVDKQAKLGTAGPAGFMNQLDCQQEEIEALIRRVQVALGELESYY